MALTCPWPEREVEEDGVGFMDDWSRFYGIQELYARNGVHFSRKGMS